MKILLKFKIKAFSRLILERHLSIISKNNNNSLFLKNACQTNSILFTTITVKYERYKVHIVKGKTIKKREAIILIVRSSQR
jgi:hypothetical protein